MPDPKKKTNATSVSGIGLGAALKHRNYQEKISRMGAEILARTKAKKNGQE
jgi:hypothetical protein